METVKLNKDLLKAVHDGDLESAEVSILSGANVNTRIGDNNSTPLIMASIQSNARMMKFLLDKGADIHAYDSDGNYAIHYCAANGYLEGVKLLLSRRSLPHIGNKNMFTPMMCAANKGYLGIVHCFLEHGVPMRYGVNKYGRSELTLACEKGFTDIVKLLLQSGDPKIDRSAEIDHAFQSAINNGKIDAVKILLQHGAKVNMKTKTGNPLIFETIEQQDPALLQLLVSNGADVNVRDKLSYTPLIKAVMIRRVDMAKILIEAGADIYATKSITAISIARELRDEALLDLMSGVNESKCNTKACES
nr:ankyrin repeat and KH domain containing protein [Hymenolepis microstoma]